MDAAYKKADPLVRGMVEKKYPPGDMKICEKYGLTQYDSCIRLKYPNGVVQQFQFSGEKYTHPMVPQGYCHSRMYLADQKTADAVEHWADAAKAFKEEKEKRIKAYEALIKGSRYVEDVAEVWPEAATIFPSEGRLILLNEDTLATIKADLKEQKKAA